jgi:hypothetical protein
MRRARFGPIHDDFMTPATIQFLSRPRSRGSVPPTVAAVLPFFVLAVGLVVPAPAVTQECPPWEDGGEKTSRIQSDVLGESSGLAASERHDGLFWTHNDSGNEPRLFLYRPDGAVSATVRMIGAGMEDSEDMAVGPCAATSSPKRTEQCIYLGDIGDNNEKRDSVQILKFPEPDLPDDRPTSVTVDDWERIQFQYEGGPRDAETLMVHPETAKIYVIQKKNSVEAPVFRVPNQPTDGSQIRTAEQFAALRMAHGLGRQVTAGDISPDGREFTIRTYVKVYTYCAETGEPFETAFSADPVISQPRLTIQSEALAYDATDDYIWFTSEGAYPPVVRMKRAPAGTEGGKRGETEPSEPASKQVEREDESD